MLDIVIDHNEDDKVELAEFLNLAEIVFWTKIEEEETEEIHKIPSKTYLCK